MHRSQSICFTRAVQPVATCRQSPYLHKPAIVIVTFHFDVIRACRAYGAGSPRCHYDVIFIMMYRAYGARSPRSHYDVTLIVTSFDTELATPTVTDVRTLHTDPFLLYCIVRGGSHDLGRGAVRHWVWGTTVHWVQGQDPRKLSGELCPQLMTYSERKQNNILPTFKLFSRFIKLFGFKPQECQ